MQSQTHVNVLRTWLNGFQSKEPRRTYESLVFGAEVRGEQPSIFGKTVDWNWAIEIPQCSGVSTLAQFLPFVSVCVTFVSELSICCGWLCWYLFFCLKFKLQWGSLMFVICLASSGWWIHLCGDIVQHQAFPRARDFGCRATPKPQVLRLATEGDLFHWVEHLCISPGPDREWALAFREFKSHWWDMMKSWLRAAWLRRDSAHDAAAVLWHEMCQFSLILSATYNICGLTNQKGSLSWRKPWPSWILAGSFQFVFIQLSIFGHDHFEWHHKASLHFLKGPPEHFPGLGCPMMECLNMIPGRVNFICNKSSDRIVNSRWNSGIHSFNTIDFRTYGWSSSIARFSAVQKLHELGIAHRDISLDACHGDHWCRSRGFWDR